MIYENAVHSERARLPVAQDEPDTNTKSGAHCNPRRAISSTLGDMENRYNRAIERTALLEHELVDKARLEEELQRVKDELRGTSCGQSAPATIGGHSPGQAD